MVGIKYKKRYDINTGRQLCVGDNNTCPNLSGYKQTIKDKKYYHNECDKHRRWGHFQHDFNNPNSKTRYIPLTICALCNNKAQCRHRIDRSTGYVIHNIILLCNRCHKDIHLC